MLRIPTFSLIFGLVSAATATSNPFPFSPGFDIEKVALLAESIPSHSWEYGTAAEALLELHNPDYSVFGARPFPVPACDKNNVKALSYAASKIIIGTGKDALSNGDGAVGDPASLGVSAVLLGKTNETYAKAAKETIDYVVNEAPRYWNGAISHRADVPELWADFMYMAPPFLAYYAADTKNESLLRESVAQCKHYREILRANTTEPHRGVWHHIIGPQSQDLGLWSTGNAWAAAGMARIVATVIKAPMPIIWRQLAVAEVTGYIKEIVDGAMASTPDDGLLRNYLDILDVTQRGFGEVSGSSLIAAVIYRMHVLQPWVFTKRYVQWADDLRITLGGNDASGNPHVTSTGIVTPAVNPLGWHDTKPFTTGSPEGQGFVVLLYAAWRDCVLADRCQKHGGHVKRSKLRL
ncbi:family 88 glycosyl hydrolase [Crassisporium funariophilum]|nr:family 88 glycosyl hydrolase [Crassisporium funariophilum]